VTETGSTTTREGIQRLAPWHFNIEVEPGLWTKDCNRQEYESHDHNSVGLINPAEMTPLLKTILPGGIEGKTFLDVGCNGGGYCFVAHDLGARRAFGFDARDHWINQAKFIRSVRYSDADSIQFQVADIKTFQRDDERFDVTLFKGVFYHLPDPISVLCDICNMTERAVVVDTAARSDIPESAIIPVNESKTHVMSGIDGLAWVPGGPAAVKAILEWAGFPHMRVVWWKHGTPETGNRSRFRVFATREESDQVGYAGPEYERIPQ
jgi:tRNA (mo5U34)-methyltransferase